MPAPDRLSEGGLDGLLTKADFERFIKATMEKPANRAKGVALGSCPVGAMLPYAAAAAPAGWLTCDGQSLERVGVYAVLFGVIGTTYGAADADHFNIPDMRGRVPVGEDASAVRLATLNAIGQEGGADTVTLATGDIPSHTHGPGTLHTDDPGGHTHSIDSATFNQGGGSSLTRALPNGGAGGNVGTAGAHSHDVTSGVTGATGGGTDHENMPPYQVVEFIIRY